MSGVTEEKDRGIMEINENMVRGSLDGAEIISGRKNGNTTRIVNNAIDLLFRGYVVRVEDHIDTGRMRKYVLSNIIRRLQIEHRLTKGQYDVRKERGMYIKLNLQNTDGVVWQKLTD